MGLPEGAACTFEGKPGICQGPHPSRISCIISANGSAEAAGSAGSAQVEPPAKPQPATTPAKQRGCAVSGPGSAAALAVAALVLIARRRRSRSEAA